MEYSHCCYFHPLWDRPVQSYINTSLYAWYGTVELAYVFFKNTCSIYAYVHVMILMIYSMLAPASIYNGRPRINSEYHDRPRINSESNVFKPSIYTG